ncbi:MAG: DUF4386 domain-containing protein [Ornithinimicrobium sp.]
MKSDRTARITGLFYLGLAASGLILFLLVTPQLYVSGDGAATAANLVQHEGLARFGIAAELVLVVAAALASVWFFRLFRAVDSFAAGCLAAFGLVNAVIMMVGAVFTATALQVALEPGQGFGAIDPGATVGLLYQLHGAAWSVGALFFGLWLIPMGWLVLRSGSMPRPLGWILIGGGIGYVFVAFVAQLAPGATTVADLDLLSLPASIGEFWLIGYLLLVGVRRNPTPGAHVRHSPSAPTVEARDR